MGYVKTRRRKSGDRHTAYYLDPMGTVRSAGTFDSWRAADTEWKRMEGRIADGRWTDPGTGKITFREFVDHVYWPNYASIREASTRQAYYYMLHRHQFPKFGNVALKDISVAMIQGWINDFTKKKGLSAATARKHRMLLSKILNVAIKTGHLVTANPCLAIELPTVPERIMKVITPEQFDVLYNTLPEEWQMLVEIGIVTGCRWGELAELRRLDFDPGSRILTVQRAVAEVSRKATGEAERYVVKPYTKGKKPRRIKIDQVVAKRLAAHILKHGLADEDLLFSTTTGTHLSRNTFRTRIWLDARRKSNLDAATMHGLRHAHASWMLAAGRDLQEVKERMGHSLITTTQQYLHTVDIESDEAVDAFTAFRNRRRPA